MGLLFGAESVGFCSCWDLPAWLVGAEHSLLGGNLARMLLIASWMWRELQSVRDMKALVLIFS